MFASLIAITLQPVARNMDPEFIHNLDTLRERVGFPFRITSGWRDATHPVEARKEKPGTHNQGIACDIAVSNGFERHEHCA